MATPAHQAHFDSFKDQEREISRELEAAAKTVVVKAGELIVHCRQAIDSPAPVAAVRAEATRLRDQLSADLKQLRSDVNAALSQLHG